MFPIISAVFAAICNFFTFWAHPRAFLPYGQAGARTGLSACIFFARGKKGYRSNPLRCGKTASLPFYRFEFLRGKNS
jgi:hypothetical protein